MSLMRIKEELSKLLRYKAIRSDFLHIHIPGTLAWTLYCFGISLFNAYHFLYTYPALAIGMTTIINAVLWAFDGLNTPEALKRYTTAFYKIVKIRLFASLLIVVTPHVIGLFLLIYCPELVAIPYRIIASLFGARIELCYWIPRQDILIALISFTISVYILATGLALFTIQFVSDASDCRNISFVRIIGISIIKKEAELKIWLVIILESITIFGLASYYHELLSNVFKQKSTLDNIVFVRNLIMLGTLIILILSIIHILLGIKSLKKIHDEILPKIKNNAPRDL